MMDLSHMQTVFSELSEKAVFKDEKEVYRDALRLVRMVMISLTEKGQAVGASATIRVATTTDCTMSGELPRVKCDWCGKVFTGFPIDGRCPHCKAWLI